LKHDLDPIQLPIRKPWLRWVERLPIPKELKGQFPFSLPLVQKTKKLDLHPDVTFLVGENGSGKSTLLEAIAVAWGFNAEGGNKNVKFVTKASHSPLHEILKLQKSLLAPANGYFLRAESFYNLATYMDSDSGPNGFGLQNLHHVSHGELFLASLLTKFKPNGFFICDEPEAALSAQRQMAAVARIHQLVQQGSQFIIATHSPILLAYPNAKIYECTPKGLKHIDYEDTEAYRLTRGFLNDHHRMLEELMKVEID